MKCVFMTLESTKEDGSSLPLHVLCYREFRILPMIRSGIVLERLYRDEDFEATDGKTCRNRVYVSECQSHSHAYAVSSFW